MWAGRGRRIAGAVLSGLLLLSPMTHAAGGWVIEREERPDSPLLKDRKSIALSPVQQEKQQLALAYQQALQAEQQRIREHWASPETSSQSRWITYSPDYSAKKAVDFERNQVEISIDGIHDGSRLDFAAMARKVQTELEDTLGTSLQKAQQRDPVQVAVTKAFSSRGGRDDSAETGAELVLKELFTSLRPTETDVRTRAAALMRNASIRYQALSASIASVPVNTGKKLTYVIPLPDNRIRRKVLEYKPVVSRNAQRFNLSEDIIMAIIHTESHFNPLARSHTPAFGLMQIVPSTAGREASLKLFQEERLLTPPYLLNPRQNIEVGAAYLSVLYYDYLKDIRDPNSRLYYTIAAYNGGPSNVAKAFTDKPSLQDAIDTINNLTPDQVLERLLNKAPSEETRLYVEKVLKRRPFYAKL
ncbi:MAG TPA: transglycosylase SLT domain-containing protein [Dongiaceae bacterium]|nr:transglycosylase SLT domain-containing protein [Dongiaceae bacterium]